MSEDRLLALIAALLSGKRAQTSAPMPVRQMPAARAVEAPIPATIGSDLNAQRDRFGSGLSGLAGLIGQLMGSGQPNGVRPAIPYARGSGQSWQTATYGERGDYGSSPGQMTAGLAPGQRVYNADTNSWGLKG